jgi:hypothetical protein
MGKFYALQQFGMMIAMEVVIIYLKLSIILMRIKLKYLKTE